MASITESFDGRSAAMRKSQWLAVENIDGIPDGVAVEIEDVLMHKNVEMDAGRKEPKLFSLKFKGKELQLVLNATNRKKLVEHFGVMTKDWRGKSITLYVQDGVRCPSGGKTKGIRIK
jgi:hypothetical protein